MKYLLPVFFVSLSLAFSCNKKIKKEYLKTVNIVPTEFEAKKRICRDQLNYVPDLEHLEQTPIKYIRVNFHVMCNDEGKGNFDPKMGRYFINLVLKAANGNQETKANKETIAEVLSADLVTPEYITNLAGSVYNETSKKIDMEKANKYIEACEFYANTNPKDEKSPEWLLKAAETARNISQHDKAISIYDNVMANFPDYSKAPQALFLKAFTIDDNMNQKDKAKALYEEFLAKYPNDDFAESAQFMLQNLYKSDAEIIEAFDKKREGAAEAEK